jgi:hypothetical protein
MFDRMAVNLRTIGSEGVAPALASTGGGCCDVWMSDPIPLHVAKLEPDEEVVETLSFWLAKAQSGELQGIICLGVTTKGSHMRSSRGTMDYATAIYLAQLTISDAIEDAKKTERDFELPDKDPETD